MSINLGVHHLRAVVAVADRSSFTAAAADVGVGQSALSRTVAEAERRLGARLFTRTTRRVEPTGDGREVAEHARRVLASYDDGLRQLERYATGERGSVVVACLPSVAATFLPAHVVRFRAAHPDVRLDVRDGLRDAVLASVRSGEVDLALVATTGSLAGLEQQALVTDHFSLAVPATHRLADRSSVAWTELAGEPFVAFGPESSIAGHVDRALADAGVVPGATVQAHNVGAVAGLVAAGLGVTAVPGLVLPMMAFAGVVAVPLVDPVVRRTISLVRLAGRHESTSARRFRDLLVAG
ncbi:LysR family transcriptional regulator [Rhodococcus aerolatus]